MADFLVREGEIEFSKPIARAVLRDGRLSFGARGLFAFLWDLPNGWEPNRKHLASMGPEGKDAIGSRLKELQSVGAMRIEPIRNVDGTLSGRRWVLANPQKWARISPLSSSGGGHGTEEGEIRASGSPTLGLAETKVHLLHGSSISEAAESASPQGQKGGSSLPVTTKRRRVRASGMVTWTPDDESLAEKLEDEYSAELVKAAVAASANPLPGIVQEHLLRLSNAKLAIEAQDKILKQVSLIFSAEIEANPQSLEAGERYLKTIRDATTRRKHAP